MRTSIESMGVAALVALAAPLAVAPALVLAADNGAGAERPRLAFGFGTTPSNEELQRFFSSKPDGTGLPPGSGNAEQGKAIYAQQCASCHGENLQGGIGDRLIGGRGTLVNDSRSKSPVKTVESYWPYATTLVDYIKRAMPLNAPGSLGNDEVYAVSAYILAQAKILPADAMLDAHSAAALRMPNRDGFVGDPRPEKFPPVKQTPHEDAVLKDAAK
jgi:cytochrome c